MTDGFLATAARGPSPKRIRKTGRVSGRGVQLPVELGCRRAAEGAVAVTPIETIAAGLPSCHRRDGSRDTVQSREHGILVPTLMTVK